MASPSSDMCVSAWDYQPIGDSRKRSSPLVDCLLPLAKQIKTNSYPTLNPTRQHDEHARDQSPELLSVVATNADIEREEHEKAESELKSANKKIEELKKQLQQQQYAREEAEKQVETHKKDVETANKERDDSKSKLETANQTIREKDQKLHQKQGEGDETAKHVKALEGKVETANEECDNAQSELRKANKTIEEKDQTLRQQQKERDEAVEQANTLTAYANTAEEERNATTSRVNEADNRIVLQADELRRAREAQEEAHKQIRELKERLQAEVNERQVAQSRAGTWHQEAIESANKLRQYEQNARDDTSKQAQELENCKAALEKTRTNGESQLQKLESWSQKQIEKLKKSLEDEQSGRKNDNKISANFKKLLRESEARAASLQSRIDKHLKDQEAGIEQLKQMHWQVASNYTKATGNLQKVIHETGEAKREMVQNHKTARENLQTAHSATCREYGQKLASAKAEVATFKEAEKQRMARAAASGHGGHAMRKESPGSMEDIGKIGNHDSRIRSRGGIEKPAKRSTVSSLRKPAVTKDLHKINPDPYKKKIQQLNAKAEKFSDAIDTIIQGTQNIGLNGARDSEQGPADAENDGGSDEDPKVEMDEGVDQQEFEADGLNDSGYESMISSFSSGNTTPRHENESIGEDAGTNHAAWLPQMKTEGIPPDFDDDIL